MAEGWLVRFHAVPSVKESHGQWNRVAFLYQPGFLDIPTNADLPAAQAENVQHTEALVDPCSCAKEAEKGKMIGGLCGILRSQVHA